ncbi:MAG: DNA N-6-adenine-methyltransferase [Luteimonas sp.]
MKYEIHPIANIFPSMSDSEFQALKADIEQYGQREPVWLYEDKVIDGRHRMRACDELGLPLRTEVYDGFDATAFVVSLNLHRRHLDESQRAKVAAKLANIAQGQFIGNQHVPSANLQTPAVSQSRAAELLNVGTRTVAAAAKVERDSPEVFEQIGTGGLSVNLASQVSELPPEERQVVVTKISESPAEAKTIAREAVKAHVANNSGNNEWYTPAEYIEAARRVMGGIDVDPASSAIANSRVQALTYFTAEDDGLKQEWHGRVWMNPPYAQPLIANFADAVAEKYAGGEIEQACVLVNNATDTAWFHTMLAGASAVCFPRGRIRFIDPQGNPSGAPLQGQAVLYFGESAESFATEFSQFGRIVHVDHDAEGAIQEVTE